MLLQHFVRSCHFSKQMYSQALYTAVQWSRYPFHTCFLKMSLLSPTLTLFMPSETTMKDIMKQLERTLVIDEVIIKKLFFLAAVL